MDYETFFRAEIDSLHEEGRYPVSAARTLIRKSSL